MRFKGELELGVVTPDLRMIGELKSGRVSIITSPVVNFDECDMVATTRSGSIYCITDIIADDKDELIERLKIAKKIVP